MAYTVSVSHPEFIVRTLDRHLKVPTKLIVYGRAALSLGFPAFAEAGATLDVDAILPSAEMHAIEQDDQFWEALDNTNAELEPSGRYITHLFGDDQVVLTEDWLEHLVAIPLAGLGHLQLFRPGVGDLILTKMMRIDPQDRADIEFLISQLPDPGRLLDDFVSRARVPAVPEVQQAFEANRLWIANHLPPRNVSEPERRGPDQKTTLPGDASN